MPKHLGSHFYSSHSYPKEICFSGQSASDLGEGMMPGDSMSLVWEGEGSAIGQWFPTFLVPGTSFLEDNFSTEWGSEMGGWFQDETVPP